MTGIKIGDWSLYTTTSGNSIDKYIRIGMYNTEINMASDVTLNIEEAKLFIKLIKDAIKKEESK